MTSLDKMINSISAYVLTLNSERLLEAVLASVKDVADEIVVVDSGSTDRTCEIASSFGAKILFRKFDNFRDQRTFAEENCTSVWTLALDSDEILSDELINKIKYLKETAFLSDDAPDGYSIRRKWFFLGREVHTFYPVKTPDYTVRLFRHDKIGHKNSRIIHEAVQGKNTRILPMDDPILHYSCDSVHELYSKVGLYTLLTAKDMYQNGVRSSYVKIYVYPWLLWIKWFFINGGWKDGHIGVILCKYARDTVYLKYLKLKYDQVILK